jgi:hypothetical protein
MKKTHKWTTPSGTVHRVFEIHENNARDESGQLPVFVTPTEDDKKQKKRNSIN